MAALGSGGAKDHRPMAFPPARIVCLTEETVETLYLLGEEARIVGVSGYAVRPARVRKEKPRVSAFISADVPKILALEPDLVLAFSDLQADIVKELIRAGIAVHAFNQRTTAGILDMVRLLATLIGVRDKGEALAARLQLRLDLARQSSCTLPLRPRIYFEEWNDPMICAIAWVSELIDAAGGIDVFASRANNKAAKDRIVSLEDVIAAEPDMILGSWCGKRFRPEHVCARGGFEHVPAVRNHALYEIRSSIILQPGPAALTDGLDAIVQRVRTWVGTRGAEHP
jgi:iron complex transport system substrate-binding protein